MRKNKMMRFASGLLAATLLTTSAMSGTYAKYVTVNSGTDKARVAKFGVNIEIADDMNLFQNTYAKDDKTNTNAEIVNTVSANTRLVAPGTKGQMSFKISGTSEVATAITVDVTDEQTIRVMTGDHILPAGQFADKECKVNTRNVYEPIKWYFGTDEITNATVYDKTLLQLKTELKKLKAENPAGTALDKTYYIGWCWEYEPDTDFAGTWYYDGKVGAPYENAKIVNFLDTYLGSEETPQTEAFTLKVMVSQID